ncbi:MAG: ABC transporter ATP-binding protein [Bacillota bacterium]
MAIVYRVEHLTKVYKGGGSKANDALSFTINEGEIFGLLGPNGAGKSTLVGQLAGLLRPTAGRIQLYGMDIVAQPDLVAEYVALQPQHSMALFDLYPEEAIYHTGRFRGLSDAAAKQQCEALMAELSLEKLRRTQIRRLSGGQKKLITLAVAFVGNRPVMIFDEPTNELDPEVRRLVWEKLQGLNRQGATIILVTHNVLEAERVIQRVGIINHGRLMALGTPGELKSRVDQRVRLELLFKHEDPAAPALLEHYGEVRPLTRQQLNLLCEPGEARTVIDRVLAEVGLERLDDFRILTPSLEDVYLALGGGAKLG